MIVMVPSGSVAIFVTPGIMCHVWICVVLKFQQSLRAQTTNGCKLVLYSFLLCTTLYDAINSDSSVSNVEVYVV